MKKCKFRGKGYFPLDMLRYDRCWPASTDDVTNMIYTSDDMLNDEELDIEMCTDKSEFTLERWASFGWKKVIIKK